MATNAIVEGQSGTRDRILHIVHGLYNDRGPVRVTNAEVAAATGLAEGNVHYHFRKKTDFVDALFTQLEADTERIMARMTPGGSTIELVAEHQRDWFRLLYDHRWYFRDPLALFTIAPAIVPRVQSAATRNRRFVRSILDEFVAAGFMRATPGDLDRLIVNIWLVATHWIGYRHLTTGRTTLTVNDLEWGFAQVVALYAPYLTRKGKRLASSTFKG